MSAHFKPRQFRHVFNGRCVVLVLGLAACVLNGCGEAPRPASTTSPGVTVVSVVDDRDNHIDVPLNPQRIVSLTPANTELLFAIGAGDQVVGVTSYCNFPKQASKVTRVGGFLSKGISLEAIVALKPDLVLAGLSHKDVAEELRELGLTCLEIEPQTLDKIRATIVMLGKVTKHDSQATQLADELKNREQKIRERAVAIPPSERQRVFYQVWPDPVMTAGRGSFIDQLLDIAGCENVFGDLDSPFPQISDEVVLQRDPQVIIGPQKGDLKLLKEKIRDRPGWSAMSAVKEDRIYFVDEDIVSRPGPRVVDALETFFEVVYGGQSETRESADEDVPAASVDGDADAKPESQGSTGGRVSGEKTAVDLVCGLCHDLVVCRICQPLDRRGRFASARSSSGGLGWSG